MARDGTRRGALRREVMIVSSPFSSEVAAQAFCRSGGRCECTRSSHANHPLGRCTATLEFVLRGREVPGGWEAHHFDRSGSAVLSNCQILCQECHKATWSYGR